MVVREIRTRYLWVLKHRCSAGSPDLTGHHGCMTSPVDMGIFFAELMKTAITAAFTEYGLAQPAQVMTTPGTSIPIHDCCDGLMWVRVDTVYPTNGDGNPFGAARADFDIPGWVYPIHMGILWCHPSIDAEGYAPDPAQETDLAHRDGQYRMAMLAGIVERFPTAAKPFAEGWRINPWQPYGPEGGCSGGHLLINVVSNYLIALV